MTGRFAYLIIGLCVVLVATYLFLPNQKSDFEKVIRTKTGKTFAAITADTLISIRELDFQDHPQMTKDDLAKLPFLTNLEKLNLAKCNLSDISPLGEVRNLKELNLSENKISDVTPLSNLNRLKILDLANNADLHKISSLAGIQSLEELYLEDPNQISDTAELMEQREKMYKGTSKILTIYFKRDLTDKSTQEILSKEASRGLTAVCFY
jgi:hypothetical protein